MSKVFRRKNSSRWYGNLTMASGKRKQVPLSEDHKASVGLLRRLQTTEDRNKALGITETTKRRSEPLGTHIAEYRERLRSKGNCEDHIDRTIRRITRVVDALKARTISDLSSDKVSNLLARWRREGPPTNRPGHKPTPIGIESSNHHVRALKAFGRFLWHTEIVESDPMRGLRTMNAHTDRRRIRRILTELELNRLIRVTHSTGKLIRGKDWTLSGPDRAVLYRLASFSGLRASELGSMCPSSINVEAGTISIQAGYTKNRTGCVLPLHPELSGILKPWIESRNTESQLWPGRWPRLAASILKRDLALAEIPYQTAEGIADFHSLRAVAITRWVRAGVPVAVTQRLARHSTPALTLNVYARLGVDDLRDALRAVPGLETKEK